MAEVAKVKVTIGDITHEVVVDERTFTIGERRKARTALAALGGESDELDMTAAAVWVVLHRTAPDVTLEDVLDNLTIGDIQDAATDKASTKDDSPEA